MRLLIKILSGMMTLCLAVILLSPTYAAAEEKISELFLAPTFTYFTWKEYNTLGQQLVKETGPLFGLRGAARAVPIHNESGHSLTLSGNLELYGGVVQYDGHQNITNLPVSTDVAYIGSRLGCDAGWGIPVQGSTVGPFAGFTYRFWVRDLHSSTTFDGTGMVPVSGATEYWNDISARFGGRWFDIRFAPEWRLFIEGGAQYSLYASNSIDTGFGNVTLEPEGMWSGFAEAGVRYKGLRLAVTFEEMRYGRSPSLIAGRYYVSQPASTAEYLGFSVGYIFR